MFKDNIFTGTFQDYSVWFLIFFAIYFSEKQANGELSKDILLPVIIFVIPVLISFLLWFLLWLGKKEKCSFSRKKIISSLMLMLYTVIVVLSVSLGMIIEYHTIVEYIYPWKMFLSIHFISIYTVNMVKGGNMAHCKLKRQWQNCSWAARITCNTQHFYGSLWKYQRT